MIQSGLYEWKKCGVGVELSKCSDNSTVVEIDDVIEAKNVVKVGRSAFSERRMLEEVALGRYVREIDNNAFYNCRNLRVVELWDGLRSVGDGAFRNCEKLEKILLHVEEGRVSCIRDILSDCQREMVLHLMSSEGETCLFFPEYELEYTAEGFTLSVHFTTIEHGSGYAYRQCMQGTGVDYRYYDSLFERSTREDRGPASAAVACMRLRYPTALTPSAGTEYREWLKHHAVEAVCWILESGQEDWLRFLREQGIFSRENLPECIRAAREAEEPSVTAFLLTMSMELSEEGQPLISRRRRYEL